MLFKSVCSGPRAIRGESESGPKVPVQLAKLSVSGVDVGELERWESKPIKASRVEWNARKR